MFYAGTRRVYVVTGAKTQTVNICDDANLRGEYESVLRLSPPSPHLDSDLTERNFSSTDELIRHLCTLGARDEGARSRTPQPANGRSTKASRLVTYQGDRATWVSRATALLEESINELVQDFLEHPHLHRVEHSIHAELYRILKATALFSQQLPGKGFVTQPVHKEWPEWNASEGKRRGNYDLAVLAPSTVADAHQQDFRGGYIEPFAVVEIGLDYGLDHLSSDYRKLANSGIERRYLIHLQRDTGGGDLQDTEAFVLEHHGMTAYATAAGSCARWKLLGESGISVSRADSSTCDKPAPRCASGSEGD